MPAHSINSPAGAGAALVWMDKGIGPLLANSTTASTVSVSMAIQLEQIHLSDSPLSKKEFVQKRWGNEDCRSKGLLGMVKACKKVRPYASQFLFL